jgi:hypothetical protein
MQRSLRPHGGLKPAVAETNKENAMTLFSGHNYRYCNSDFIAQQLTAAGYL